MEKTIFKAKHRCWSNDGGFWEDITDYFLATPLDERISSVWDFEVLWCYLCAEEFGRGADIGIVRRDMDKPVNVIFGNSFCNTFGSFNIDILKVEVPNQSQNGGWSGAVAFITYLVGYVRPTRL